MATRAVAVDYTWGSSTTGGSWSVTTNWTPTGAPTSGDTALLGDAGADRSVFYNSAASGTLATLSFTQTSAFLNELQVQRALTVTNAVTLGASSGTARLFLQGTAATGTSTFSGGVTVNSGGVLSLGLYNPAGTTTYVSSITGNVAVAGGRFELAPITKLGTATGAGNHTLTGNLTMTSGTFFSDSSTSTDRRLYVSGNVSVSGGSWTSNASLDTQNMFFTGTANTFNPTTLSNSFAFTLDRSGDQALSSVATNFQTLTFRGTGIKTVSNSGTIARLQFLDNSTSLGSRTTLKLGSNLTSSNSPVGASFSQSADSAGNVEFGIDADRYTLDFSSANAVWTPTKLSGTTGMQSGTASNTIWALTGTAGTIRATGYNFATSGTTTLTTTIGPGLVLVATGGTSTNVLSGSGTIDPTSIFRFSGTTTVSGTPATLSSDRALGDLEVTSGALRLGNTFTSMQNVRVSGGSLDLLSKSLTVPSVRLTGGTITTGTLTSSGTFDMQAGTLSAAILGSGSLAKTGAGTVVLSGSNGYSGTTTISGGVLSLGVAESAGTSGPLGTNTTAGAIVLSGGTLQYSASNQFDYSSRFSTAASQQYAVDTNGQSVTFATALASSGGSLTKSGAGTLTLTNANTYDGGTTISGGTLQIGNGSTTGSIAGDITNNAILAFNRSDSFTFGAVISGSGAVTKTGTGTLTLTNANTHTGTTTVTAGALALGDGGTTGSLAGPIALTNTTALVVNRSNDLTLGGAISGTGSLTKQGAGTLALTAANTFVGTTTITAGTVALSGGDNRLATGGTVSFAGNGGLSVSGSQSLASLTLANNVAAALTGSGTTTVTGGAFFIGGTGTNTFQTLNASGLSSFAYNNSGSSFKVGGNNSVGPSSGRLVLPTTSAIAASSIGIGADGVNSNVASGTLTLGTTTAISANTITLGANQAQGTIDYAVGTANPVLTLRGSNGTSPVTNMTIGTSGGYGLTTTSRIDLSSGVTGVSTLDALVTNLVIGVNVRSGTSTSAILTGGMAMGGGTLTSGTIVLGRAITNTGTAPFVGTPVTTGSLSVAGGTVNVDTLFFADQNWNLGTVNGIFRLDGGGTLNAGTIASGTGTGSGTVVRTFTWNDGTIANRDASTDLTIGSGITFNLASTGTHRFSIGTGRSGTMASVLAGAGGTLEKAGAGALTLSASNSYSGGTTLAAGTLALGNASALGASTSGLTVNAGTLDLAGFSATIGALSGSAGGTITTSNAAGTATLTTSFVSGTSTFGGSIADNGSGLIALTKAGAGTLTLSAGNAYSGGTQLNGGVLSLGDAGAIGSAGTISFGGGSLRFTAANAADYSNRFSTAASQAYALDTNGQSVTLGTALTSSGGSLTKSGAGTLTLTQDATFSGTTTVSAGTLALGDGGTAGGLAGAISLTSGASLVVNRSNDLTLAGAISGTGSLTKQGAATLTLAQDAAIAALSLTDPAGATSTVLTQRNLTVTGPVTLGATSGTARLYLLPATATNATATFSGGITVNASGMLSLGGFNPTGSAAVGAGLVSGNVTIAGGILDLSALVKQGSAGNFQGSTISGNLSMASGTLRFVDAGLGDRRLTVTGNFDVSGGSVAVDNGASTLGLSGSTNTLAPTSFDIRLGIALGASGPQSFAASVPIGLLRPRGAGVKTISSSAVGTSIATLSFIDGDASQTAGVTARLASNLSVAGSPNVENFSNQPNNGRIDAGLDADAFSLTIAGTFAPNASTQSGVTNTYWTLSGTAGTMRAAAFNFGSGSTTVDVGTGLVLTATGGNSAANVLSGSGTIAATTIFRYAGSAAAGTPATLVSNRAIGDLEVTSGALRVTGLNGAQAARISGGTLDLGNSTHTFTSAQLTGGSITSGTLTTAGGFDLRSGVASGVLAGASSLSKTTSGTVTLSGANTYAGATSVAAGTLLVNGDQSAAIGAFTVDAGATLGGSGTIGGATTVNGLLSPGNSPGVLTLAELALGSTSTTLMEITGAARGNDYDGVTITGSNGLTYGGALSLSFATTFGDNTTFDLFAFTGLPSGGFSSVTATGSYGSLTFINDGFGVWTSGPTNVAGQTMTFTQSTGDLVIVPEPASLLLVGLGAAFVAWSRRRRI